MPKILAKLYKLLQMLKRGRTNEHQREIFKRRRKQSFVIVTELGNKPIFLPSIIKIGKSKLPADFTEELENTLSEGFDRIRFLTDRIKRNRGRSGPYQKEKRRLRNVINEIKQTLNRSIYHDALKNPREYERQIMLFVYREWQKIITFRTWGEVAKFVVANCEAVHDEVREKALRRLVERKLKQGRLEAYKIPLSEISAEVRNLEESDEFFLVRKIRDRLRKRILGSVGFRPKATS